MLQSLETKCSQGASKHKCSCETPLILNSWSARRTPCCMIVQMSSAERHDRGNGLVGLREAREQHGERRELRGRARTRSCSCCARHQTKICRSAPLGKTARLRLDLTPRGPLGPLARATATLVTTASSSLSGVRVGQTSLLGDRRVCLKP